MPPELTALIAIAIASAVYLVRLSLLTSKATDDSYIEDLEDRVGALESMAEEVGKAQVLAKDLKLAVQALDEKLEIEKAANDRANKNLIQKLNKHELQLGQVAPRGR